MSEAFKVETAQLISALTAAGLAAKQVGESWHVYLAPGYQHKDISDLVEKALPAPARKRTIVELGDVPSLIAYCKDQAAEATGYIYANADARTLTAVFNDAKAGPGWRDHRAIFKAELTPEAKKWIEKDGQAFGQTEFAEFIEDNFADLQGDEAANLLTVATTIAASTGINFSSARRLQDGQTQLVYNETINATAGADGSLSIPKTFTLGLRLFKNGDGYKLAARLKYRLHGSAVKFWYELERPENAIDDAFKGYVAKVTEASGYTVLLGKA